MLIFCKETTTPQEDDGSAELDDEAHQPNSVKPGYLNMNIGDHNNAFYTTLFVGSAQEEVKLSMDTISTMSVIASSMCVGCNHDENKGFEYKKSNSIRKFSDQWIKYNVGDTIAEGIHVYDDIRM